MKWIALEMGLEECERGVGLDLGKWSEGNFSQREQVEKNLSFFGKWPAIELELCEEALWGKFMEGKFRAIYSTF